MIKNLSLILSIIKKSRPPCSLDLARKLSYVNWNLISEKQIDIAKEIILLISATVIVCNYNIDSKIKLKYKKYFLKIVHNVNNSDLIYKSNNFSLYFQKFSDLVDEL